MYIFDILSAALPSLWEMSLTAAYVTAVVAVLRLALRKRAPKQVLCLLWLVVFARLLVPLSLESPVSIVPDALPRQEQLQLDSPAAPNQGGGVQTGSNPLQPDAVTAAPPAQGEPNAPALTVPDGVTPSAPQEPQADFPWQSLLAVVWLAGALVMGGYGLISFLRLKSCFFDAIQAQDGAWEHPAVRSPFILGMFRPRIYLPAGLHGMSRQFILCHERAHLRRLDHIVKPICWVALALHWFNPAVWVAFILMSRDIEAACDEAVIRQLGPRVKADYSATLLSLATNGRVPAPCPLAFDEGDAKGRIKNVLRYRRPALWIVVVSVVMVLVAAVCLLTDPVSAREPGPDPDPDPSASDSQSPEGLNHLLDPWMLDVLNGERTFTSGGEDFNIHQLRAMVYGDGELPKLTLEVGKLAIIDLDKDGINEMVVWPTGESVDSTEVGYYTGYFIFRRQGDMVYVDYPGWRVIGDLKADGTFDWSGSAFEWGTGRARFDHGMFEVERITWQEGMEAKNYFVNGLSATQEEFEAAWAAHQAKPEPTWYVFEDGLLKPCLPDSMELAAETDPVQDTGEAKLWLQGGEIPWLEWNGSTSRLNCLVTPAQFPGISCRDFDGDGQDEVIFSYNFNGFLKLDLYEWESDRPTLAASYDTQDILLRFNQYNVGAVSPYGGSGEYALTLTYAHVEGEDTSTSTDFYRHYVHGRCVLPADFFDGYEHILDYTYAYANGFHLSYLNDANEYYFDFEFYLADETMQELTYVDTLSAMPPYSWYAEHYMIGKPVGTAYFTLRYDGTQWKLKEGDQLTMNYGGDPSIPPSASPEPTPSAAPEPTASVSSTACVHGLEDIRLEYVGSQLAALCNQCDFIYLVPGVTSANWNGTTGLSDGGGWVKEDLDGDDYTELLVYTADHWAVSLKMVNGAPVASSFDLQTLVNDFNQNSEYRMDPDNKVMEVSYQGRTKQANLDDGFWSYMLNHSGGFEPEIWPDDYWANRLGFGFRVHNARGDKLGITALWALSYDANGRLQTGSFWW